MINAAAAVVVADGRRPGNCRLCEGRRRRKCRYRVRPRRQHKAPLLTRTLSAGFTRPYAPITKSELLVMRIEWLFFISTTLWIATVKKDSLGTWRLKSCVASMAHHCVMLSVENQVKVWLYSMLYKAIFLKSKYFLHQCPDFMGNSKPCFDYFIDQQ